MDGIKRRQAALFLMLSVLFAAVFSLQARAEERTVVRVGYPIQAGFTMKSEDGSYSGYTYDYLEELSQYTGWDYEFVEMDGDENEVLGKLLTMLEEGEIDLLGGMSYSEALAERYTYSGSSYGTTYLSLVVLDQNTAITSANYTEQRPLRTAVVGIGGSQGKKLKAYAESVGMELEMVDCESQQEQEELLNSHQVDAILRTDVAVPEYCRAIARFSPMPFYLASSKDNYDLMRQLNAGMMAILDAEPNLTTHLHQTYFRRSSSHVIYTDAERNYMDTAGVLKVAVFDGKAPIQSRDVKTGEAYGIARGVFDYISEETGLRFDFICAFDSDEYQRLLMENEVDLAIAVPFNSQVAKQFQMVNSLPYLTTSQLLIFRRGVDPSRLEGLTFAQFDSYGNPDTGAGKVLLCRSAEEAMEAVEEGRADYCYINNLSFQYCMNKRRFPNVSVVARTDVEDQEICIGIMDSGQVTLNGLLNKVIANLPPSKMQTIQYNSSISQAGFSFRDYMRDNPYQVVGAVGLVLLALLGGLFAHFRSKYKMTQKMALENERYRQLAEVVGECVYEYDYQSDHIILSQEGAKNLGLLEEVPSLSAFVREKSREWGIEEESTLYHWISEKKDGTKDVHLFSAADPRRWYRVSSKVIRDARGVPVYSIGRIWDVQAERDEREYLRERAQHDGLTGIYNAATIRELIDSALREQKEGGAFFIIDVDRFKEINDQFGHSVGDQVLIQIGRSLSRVFEDCGLYGRLGGDEFVAFARNCKDVQEAGRLAEVFRTELNQVTAIKDWDGITVSMGIALWDGSCSFESLYQKADALLYEVKRGGRDGFRCG